MITDQKNLNDVLKTLYGPGVTIAERRAVSGGCIHNAHQLILSNGEKLFTKEHHGLPRDMFRKEAEGLEALLVEGGPTMPHPLAYSAQNEHQFLLLEWIDSAPKEENFWRNFGSAFARMHKRRNERFGFHSDNYIGSTEQKNTWEDSWIAFFAKYRLGFQIRLARDRGLADQALARDIEKLINRLDTILIEDTPALLHGDLWSGNCMTGSRGEAVILDPAVYFGHREADLAMTELFGRFDNEFYRAYNEAYPLQEGYESRRDVYNLYHALNHLNLFGSSYHGLAESVVRKYV